MNFKVRPKFLSGTEVTDNELLQDYSDSKKVESVRLGRLALFWQNEKSVLCLPYAQLFRIYRRIERVGSRLSCCRMNFDQHTLILCDRSDGEVASIPFKDHRESEFVFQFILKQTPHIAQGKPKTTAPSSP